MIESVMNRATLLAALRRAGFSIVLAGWMVGPPLALVTAAVSAAGCSKSGHEAPPAPAMPPDWKVVNDVTPSARDSLFQKVQAQFAGKIRTLRVVVYEVQGHKVVLNQIEAQSPADGDQIYRKIAMKKPFFAYWRSGQIIYEFRGKTEVADQIRKAHELLMKREGAK